MHITKNLRPFLFKWNLLLLRWYAFIPLELSFKEKFISLQKSTRWLLTLIAFRFSCWLLVQTMMLDTLTSCVSILRMSFQIVGCWSPVVRWNDLDFDVVKVAKQCFMNCFGAGQMFYIYFALLQSFRYLPTNDILHYTIY